MRRRRGKRIRGRGEEEVGDLNFASTRVRIHFCKQHTPISLRFSKRFIASREREEGISMSDVARKIYGCRPLTTIYSDPFRLWKETKNRKKRL